VGLQIAALLCYNENMPTSIFQRSVKNPILKSDPSVPWRSSRVYNPGVIFEGGKYRLFYRAQGQAWVSKIGCAESDDGENFICGKHPLLEPETDREKNGVEDPRITKIDGAYYLTYNAYDGDTARLSLAVSRNLENWERRGEMVPSWEAGRAQSFVVSWDKAQVGSTHKNQWIKSGAVFPEKIRGKYWVLFGDRNLWLASSADGVKWEPVWEPFIRPRPGRYFDSIHVEMGPPPIKTKDGWLVLYHGANDRIVYRFGFLLLDLTDPGKILYRSREGIFEPEMSYELAGIVDILPGGAAAMETMSEEELKKYIEQAKDDKTMPSVIFCCGAVLAGDILRIYYGASDTVICTATAKLDDILSLIKHN
jgi:predicted GH43/DUF377 family glycosyl hydrolase